MPDRVEPAGPRAADREEMEPHDEDQEQDDRKPEGWDPEARRRGQPDNMVDWAAAPRSCDRGERNRNDEREDRGVGDEKERDRESRERDVGHIRLIEEGDPEVAMRGTPEEVHVLLPEGEVQPELVVDAGDQLRGRPGAEQRHRRVSWDDPDKHERDDAHPEQDGNCLRQSPSEVAGHAAPTPPSIVNAEPVTNRASADAR